MKQRGRKSVAALSVLSVDGQQARPLPPACLSEPERELFASIVGGCDADHFRQTDLPLLSRYCEAAILAERAARELRNGAVLVGRRSGKMRQGYGLPIHAAAFIAAVANRSENFGQAAALLRTKPLGSCRMTAAAERRDQFISLAEAIASWGACFPLSRTSIQMISRRSRKPASFYGRCRKLNLPWTPCCSGRYEQQHRKSGISRIQRFTSWTVRREKRYE